MDEQALKEEIHKTINSEDKVDLTPIGDLQYNKDLSIKFNLHHKAPKGKVKDDTPIRHDHVYYTARIENFKAQETPIKEV